jgi:hypothetical protein
MPATVAVLFDHARFALNSNRPPSNLPIVTRVTAGAEARWSKFFGGGHVDDGGGRSEVEVAVQVVSAHFVPNAALMYNSDQLGTGRVGGNGGTLTAMSAARADAPVSEWTIATAALAAPPAHRPADGKRP